MKQLFLMALGPWSLRSNTWGLRLPDFPGSSVVGWFTSFSWWFSVILHSCVKKNSRDPKAGVIIKEMFRIPGLQTPPPWPLNVCIYICNICISLYIYVCVLYIYVCQTLSNILCYLLLNAYRIKQPRCKHVALMQLIMVLVNVQETTISLGLLK